MCIECSYVSDTVLKSFYELRYLILRTIPLGRFYSHFHFKIKNERLIDLPVFTQMINGPGRI